MSSKRILIVDEAEANALFFQVILNDLGIKDVFTSTVPQAAIEMVKDEKIDFVITAWEMSAMPGTLFMQRVRGSRRTRRIPFLIYSKRLSAEDLRLTTELGMTNVLGMPFDKIKATALIKDLIDAESTLSKEEVILRKMEDLLAEGKPSECMRFVSAEMGKKGPHLSRYKSMVAEAWLQIGESEKSMKLVDEALALEPTNMQARFLKSRLFSLKGEHDAAIKVLQNMIEGSPVNLAAKVKLGNAYADAERHEEAKAVLEDVLQLDPDSRDAQDELGKIAFKEGDMPLAGKLLAETENGDMVARYFNSMAISLVAKSEFDKGIETYKNAINIIATKAKTHLLNFNLGLAYRKKGDLPKAFRTLTESYLMAPEYEKSYAALVRVTKEMREKGLPIDSALIQKIKEAREEAMSTRPNSGKPRKSAA